jgi:hypothetical protein
MEYMHVRPIRFFASPVIYVIGSNDSIHQHMYQCIQKIGEEYGVRVVNGLD